jgi:hypothetical protein
MCDRLESVDQDSGKLKFIHDTPAILAA